MRVSLPETKNIHREEGLVKLEVDKVTLPQIKDHKEKISEAEIGKNKRILPRSLILDFWALEL